MARKRKKPQVPLGSMARPLTERILVRREQGKLDDEGCVEELSALTESVGSRPVLDVLVKKLEEASDAERHILLTVIPELGDEKVIKHLWRLVRHSKMSPGVKMSALDILQQMGEDVKLEHPERYFRTRHVTPKDLSDVRNVFSHTLGRMTKELHRATSIGELERMMETIENPPEGPLDDETFRLDLIDELGKMETSDAADMLLAITSATARRKVRRAARDALMKLSGRGVFPQSSLIKRFSKEQFHAAYCTDPNHPWQQQVVMAWEWPGDLTQAMVFLLDFGFPWRGSIKDMYVTRYLTRRELHRDLIDEGTLEQRQVPFARARRFILDAIEANRRHNRPLPPEYDQFRRLIERRIVYPSEKMLAQARALDAETEDEWGVSEEQAVRGISFVDGKPIIGLDEEAMRAFEEDPESFDDYLRSIGDGT